MRGVCCRYGSTPSLSAASLPPSNRRIDRCQDNARVIVTGAFCEQPPLGLVRTLELAGCYIVWDDMSIGRRWLQADVSLEGDPIESLPMRFASQHHHRGQI